MSASTATVNMRGDDRQMLLLRSWELELSGEFPYKFPCRLGLDAVYHPNSKTLYDRGLFLPSK
jgi:hypothetical protein